MNFSRTLKHLIYPGWWLREDFPPAAMNAIEAAIAVSEKKTNGEIRFAIETSLPLKGLWRNEPVHERAIEVFSLLRVWDTENNNGVLIYLLLADKKVEITADRNINRIVGKDQWHEICSLMENEFSEGRFSEGVVAGVEAIGNLLETHFPYTDDDENELSNKPVVL